MKNLVTILLLCLLPALSQAQCRANFRLIDVIATSLGGQYGCWDTALNFGPVVYLEADTMYHFWTATMYVQDKTGKCLTPFAVGTANWGNLFGIDTTTSCPTARTLQPIGMGWSAYTGIWSGAMAAAYYTRPRTAPQPAWQIWPYHSWLYVTAHFWMGRTPTDTAGCSTTVSYVVHPCFPPLGIVPIPIDSTVVEIQRREYATGPGWVEILVEKEFQLSDMQGRTIAKGQGQDRVDGLASGIYSLLLAGGQSGEMKHTKIHIR